MAAPVTVTGLTAARMAEIEADAIVGAEIDGDNLILHKHDGSDIDAGSVRGSIGPTGSGLTICTHSTRPGGLDSTDEGLQIYETDTDLTFIWDGDNWKCQQRVICTSSTRPTLSSVNEGVKIYETDTGREYIWTGTAWALDSRPYILAETIRTVDSDPCANVENEFSGYDESVVVVSGRKYYAKFGYRCHPSVDTGIYVKFSVWQGAVGSGTRVAHAEFFLRGTEWLGAEMPLDVTTGTHTLRFSAITTTGGQQFVATADDGFHGFYQLLEKR